MSTTNDRAPRAARHRERPACRNGKLRIASAVPLESALLAELRGVLPTQIERDRQDQRARPPVERDRT
jgi:hypothetical protein